jgi:hypothetical protein
MQEGELWGSLRPTTGLEPAMRSIILSCLASLAACVGGPSRNDPTTDPTPDPAADADGDGYTLADEEECGSDPENGDLGCFDCAHPWDSTDRGPDGNDVGDVIANVGLIDTCEQEVGLWNFAGEYHILYLTGAW